MIPRDCTLPSTMERRTRILATVGPASSGGSTLRDLMDAGADAFRLNFSHGTIATHEATAAAIRAVAATLGRPIALLQDLGGPKIRVGDLPSPVQADAGQ